MTSRVAAVKLDKDIKLRLKEAIHLIGGIDRLNVAEKPVVIKVGVFSQEAENHTSVKVVDAIVNCFDRAQKIFLAESDNYKGTGSERLQIWKDIYSERLEPFNLSSDSDTRTVQIAGQQMNLSHILFKPNILVDTHILRSFEKGSILKNLFGCIPDTKRAKYHKILPTLLADVYEAIGGVDLAVLDGTYMWRGAGDAPVRMNMLFVGKDAVAVETIGAALAGLDPRETPVIQEFVKRGLGEGCLENIEVVGTSFESLQEKFKSASKAQKKQSKSSSGPQTWGGQANRAFKDLIRRGFFKQSKSRTITDIIEALEARGLTTEGKESAIIGLVERRIKKRLLKESEASGKRVYWTE